MFPPGLRPKLKDTWKMILTKQRSSGKTGGYGVYTGDTY